MRRGGEHRRDRHALGIAGAPGEINCRSDVDRRTDTTAVSPPVAVPGPADLAATGRRRVADFTATGVLPALFDAYRLALRNRCGRIDLVPD